MTPVPDADDTGSTTAVSTRQMLYQAAYVWLVLLAALDIVMTWIVLWHGGWEANPIAERVLHRFGLGGFVTYKFVLVIFVILICERVGRMRLSAGRSLVYGGVIMTAIPVVWSFVLLRA